MKSRIKKLRNISRSILILTLTLTLSNCSLWPQKDNTTEPYARVAAPKTYSYPAEIVSVYDGDTLTANLDLGLGVMLEKQKIRLYGIDTPEIRGDEKPLGELSRDWLIGTLMDAKVVIETHGTGKYGRILGVVYADGVNLNQRMVELGLAERYLE